MRILPVSVLSVMLDANSSPTTQPCPFFAVCLSSLAVRGSNTPDVETRHRPLHRAHFQVRQTPTFQKQPRQSWLKADFLVRALMEVSQRLRDAFTAGRCCVHGPAPEWASLLPDARKLLHLCQDYFDLDINDAIKKKKKKRVKLCIISSHLKAPGLIMWFPGDFNFLVILSIWIPL